MPPKPKANQPQTPDKIQMRDLFETANYAVELLIPYIPKHIKNIWECASGNNKISNVLQRYGYNVYATDLNMGKQYNFLEMDLLNSDIQCVITNPPYSLKERFYKHCLKLSVPFALLIPADYSGWIINAVKDDGAEKIIPTRRISYITPDMCNLVYRGQLLDLINKNVKPRFKRFKDIPKEMINQYKDRVTLYQDYKEIPNELLYKYSNSQFHSMWLTWGFNLERTETFVELTNKMKMNI